jgi:hypothetical protein
VFLDETGILLGLTRTHARSEMGTRAYSFNPFYRGSKVTVIGAISIKKVVALMTMDDSMDGNAFEVFTLEVFSTAIMALVQWSLWIIYPRTNEVQLCQ